MNRKGFRNGGETEEKTRNISVKWRTDWGKTTKYISHESGVSAEIRTEAPPEYVSTALPLRQPAQHERTAKSIIQNICGVSTEYTRTRNVWKVTILVIVSRQSQCKRYIYPWNKPWKPIELWEVEAPTFSRQSAHRWRWGCQPYAPAALYPQKDSWYSFLLEAESIPGP
jgi:hypothetical protein